MKLLILSNGHGEDQIAARIVEKLQQSSDALYVAALPLVGTGHAFTKLNIPLFGPCSTDAFWGFIYMDSRQLWKDIQGGLLSLTLTQWQIVCHWGQNGGKILAVGDILPLLLAWLSKANYAFVGTAKSEYYLRDETGWLPQTSWLYRLLGSYYFPWERWLMAQLRCKAVFPRDTLTTKVLQQWSIPAFDLGNPMMDGLENREIKREFLPKNSEFSDSLTILLLPGSRYPEAQQNWQMILRAVIEVISNFSGYNLRFLAAIAPSLALEAFFEVLLTQGWKQSLLSTNLPIGDSQAQEFIYNQNTTLILAQHAYAQCLDLADVAIAMAGTATEQFIGLGKPAIIIPGKAQFTTRFAEAQTRLLGRSVILVPQPQQVADALQTLLVDAQRWQEITDNGRRRMGLPGSAQRIAQCLQETLLV